MRRPGRSRRRRQSTGRRSRAPPRRAVVIAPADVIRDDAAAVAASASRPASPGRQPRPRRPAPRRRRRRSTARSRRARRRRTWQPRSGSQGTTLAPAPARQMRRGPRPVRAGFWPPSLTKPARPPPAPIACATIASDRTPVVAMEPAPIVQVELFVGSAEPPTPPVEPSWKETPEALIPVAAVTAPNPPPPPIVWPTTPGAKRPDVDTTPPLEKVSGPPLSVPPSEPPSVRLTGPAEPVTTPSA